MIAGRFGPSNKSPMKICIPALVVFITLSALIPRDPGTLYKVDVQKSSLQWTGYYLFNFGEHNGTINLKKGELLMANDQLTGGSFEIDMTSINNLDMAADEGGNDLVNHLKSDDFFSTEKFPAAFFEITKVEPIRDTKADQPNADITGTLTLKGVKNTLKFPAMIKQNGTTLTAKAKFKFDRTKWNIQYNSGKVFSDIGDNAISDAVGMELNIQATK
jgi:polyisoprenoid-binding protein YceI